MNDESAGAGLELGLCIGAMFPEMPLEQKFAKVASLGFRNVEMWVVDDSFEGGPEALARLAERNDLRITSLVIGSPDGHLGGGLTNPQNRQQWLTRAATVIDYAGAAGIPCATVCTGNRVDGLSEGKMRQSVLDGLKATAELAEKADLTLLLEPLNTVYDHPGYWLTGSDLGAELCREVGSARLKLLYDCYHMQIMEGDLAGHIGRHLDVIGHFHAAGVPGRHEIYEGEVNYRFLLQMIEQSGYRGVFTLEYGPSIDHEESLRRTVAYLSAVAPEQ